MTELSVNTFDGADVVDERECAVTGETVYTIRDEDGQHETVDVDGEERFMWEMSDGYILQCDPTGSPYLTEDGREELLERASEIIAVLPTGEVAVALLHGSIIARHYNDEYEAWDDVGLNEAFKWIACPSSEKLRQPHIDGGRYATPSGQEVAHMGGTMVPVSVDGLRPSERGDACTVFMELLRDGDVSFPAPVLSSGSTLFTVDVFADALASMVRAEVEL